MPLLSKALKHVSKDWNARSLGPALGQNVIPQLQLHDGLRRSPTWLVQEAVPRNVASRLPLHSDPARIVNLVRNASWPWRQKLIASASDFTEYWSA